MDGMYIEFLPSRLCLFCSGLVIVTNNARRLHGTPIKMFQYLSAVCVCPIGGDLSLCFVTAICLVFVLFLLCLLGASATAAATTATAATAAFALGSHLLVCHFEQLQR